ncbi:MAG: GNAT family N-acetyltransferase [Acetobacteraceae bacterium]|nr:GNAT family N-acetyltransferase [Acetobacteraceae bacterium]
MTTEDAVAAQRLLAQLGYPLELLEVRRRYDAVVRSADHAVMLADQDGTIVALCHMYVRPALDKPPEVVVQSLVVEQACRGSGMGKRMLAAAEAWAADRGFGSVALASNISRTPAHAFYEALGYRRAATSHQFRKALA